MSRRSLPLKRPSDSVTKSDVRKGRVSSIFDARKKERAALDARVALAVERPPSSLPQHFCWRAGPARPLRSDVEVAHARRAARYLRDEGVARAARRAVETLPETASGSLANNASGTQGPQGRR